MDTLKKNKYKYVKNLISSELVHFLSSWSLKNFKIKPDSQAPMSFCVHSKESEIYTHILHFLKPLIEKETNLNLKPIYSYNRIYLGGSDLKKHIDRDACEISVSISLESFYENKEYKWPLCMKDIPIVIESGDGVIYKGREIEHWRPTFTQPKECWHHQLFLHYVDLNGDFSNIEEELYYE